MSFWPAIQTALEHVFKSATGVAFVWEDEPIKVMQKPYGVLSLGQSITVGRDLSRYSFRDCDSSVEIAGFRELTIGVQVFSRQSQGESSARSLIERARLSLANPVYRDELRSAGLIFVENHPVVKLDFTFQNRKESRCAFDVVFRVMLQDSAQAHTPYFESVALESCL